MPDRSRPTHPRPQLRRHDWTPLDGDWDFALDPEAVWERPRGRALVADHPCAICTGDSRQRYQRHRVLQCLLVSTGGYTAESLFRANGSSFTSEPSIMKRPSGPMAFRSPTTGVATVHSPQI